MRQPGVKPPPEPPEWADKPHVPRGCILGYAIAHYRVPSNDPEKPITERQTLREGDTAVITTVSGAKLAPACDRFVVAGFYKSEMSEYDSSYVYVPLDHLQHLRAMDDRVTAIHLKLHDYSEAKVVVDRLQQLFSPEWYEVQTWEHKQGPLLAAIGIEKSLLNVLLFLIVAVAGFGILAIFSMIVVEKTRDIGILKALGASNFGVMKIFLSYGLLLGLVGAVLGTGLGLLITNNLNSIEKFLTKATGMEVFPRDIYYFSEIPTDVQPMTVFLVNAGAVLIAVLFSILPALRAASLHPVKALRYE
jgi:lipoprotein-releasing system permease protein